jgi:hypothetical protein
LNSNDYRADPTSRADRIRDDKGPGGRPAAKNGYVQPGAAQSQTVMAVGPSPAHHPALQGARNIVGQIVVALYTYQGSESCGDMSFQKGDQMEIIDDT